MMRAFLALAATIILGGCVTAEQLAEKKAQSAQADAQANAVKLISPEQAQKCKYINQVSAIAGLSFFGGMQETEKTAMQRLKVEAAKQGANGLRIADRMLDKGRGGSDQTRLTLYGDIYKCPKM